MQLWVALKYLIRETVGLGQLLRQKNAAAASRIGHQTGKMRLETLPLRKVLLIVLPHMFVAR